jgi:hypothetical protein
MKAMRKTTLILAALLLLAVSPAFLAAEAKFVLLGEKEVNFLVDRDDLVVALKDGMFRRLRFEVENNDLEMLRVTVTFGNGKTETIPVRHVFKEGSRSRLIDLPGQKRIIRRITFFYRTVGRLVEGRALIRVYGQ